VLNARTRVVSDNSSRRRIDDQVRAGEVRGDWAGRHPQSVSGTLAVHQRLLLYRTRKRTTLRRRTRHVCHTLRRRGKPRAQAPTSFSGAVTAHPKGRRVGRSRGTVFGGDPGRPRRPTAGFHRAFLRALRTSNIADVLLSGSRPDLVRSAWPPGDRPQRGRCGMFAAFGCHDAKLLRPPVRSASGLGDDQIFKGWGSRKPHSARWSTTRTMYRSIVAR